MFSENKQENLFLKATLISSSISGFIGKLVSHPVDTIKAKMQIDSSKLNLSNLVEKRSILHTIKSTYQNERIRGFYAGVGVASIGAIPATFLFFTSYELSKLYYRNLKFFENRDSLRFFVAGMTAETVSCLIWLPIDITKERLQVQSNLKSYHYKNSLDAAKQIIRSDGILGLYKAFGATVASFGPCSALNFMFYENFKIKICKNPQLPSFLESFFLSMLSSGLANFITSPLDMAKLRMQIQRGERARSGKLDASLAEGRFGYKNMFHGMYLILKNEGILALYKGVTPRVVQGSFNIIVSFTLLEEIRKFVLKNFYDYEE